MLYGRDYDREPACCRRDGSAQICAQCLSKGCIYCVEMLTCQMCGQPVCENCRVACEECDRIAHRGTCAKPVRDSQGAIDYFLCLEHQERASA